MGHHPQRVHYWCHSPCCRPPPRDCFVTTDLGFLAPSPSHPSPHVAGGLGLVTQAYAGASPGTCAPLCPRYLSPCPEATSPR